ncbi:MAG: hypothetical protein MJ137_02840 [Clostridia bacterium]|nr:hypothetical protein [Clostridia bacterium]
MRLSEKKILNIMYIAILLLLAGVVIAVIATDRRNNAPPSDTKDSESRAETSQTAEQDSDSVYTSDTACPPETGSEPATEPPETTSTLTEEITVPATAVVTEPHADVTTSESAPSVPFSVYVHEPKSKIWTRADVYESRWPSDDSDVGRDAQGNYKAWQTGYWTRDWWSFSGVTNLICDTTYFFVIPSDAESVTFSTTYGTKTWATEWAGLWRDAGPDGAKIGYKIERFMRDGSSHAMTVLDPSHIFDEQPYYENYLYDEVHRPDASHVTAGTMTKDTILTDIKITLRNGCYGIDYFVLTAFVYTSDADFDAAGEYTGRISASCIIKAK